MDELFNDDEVPDWFQRDADEDEGEEEEGDSSLGGTLHVLILLECTAAMFAPLVPDPEFPDERLSAATMTLQAMNQLLRTKIRTTTLLKTGKRDGVGLYLYGTRPREPRSTGTNEAVTDVDPNEMDEDDDAMYSGGVSYSNAPSTVHELLPLEPPGQVSVETIQTMVPNAFGDVAVNLEEEYLAGETTETTASESNESNDFYGSNARADNALLDALTRAVAVYASAPCVRPPKTSLVANDSRQIWLVTARDAPYDTDEERRLLLEKCKDVQDAGIELYVWPVVALMDPTRTTTFDSEAFYDAVANIPLVPSGDDDTDAATVTEEWIQTLDSHYKKTRPAYRVPLLLTGWKERQLQQDVAQDSSTTYTSTIWLDFYNLQQTSKEPPLVPIHQETGKVLGKVRQVLSTDGAVEILAEQRSFDTAAERRAAEASRPSQRLRTFLEFGSDSRVSVSLADKVAMKRQSNANTEFASLILLGFKAETAIPFYHAIEKSYFAYPSDAKSASSMDAFAHLHRSMLRQGVVAVGELLTRVTATSRLVVLKALPEELEPIDDDAPPTQRRPPGLLVTALPFNDEMRAIEPDVAAHEFDLLVEPMPEPLVSSELVQAATDLIQKQTLMGVEIGHVFQNGSMCRFWQYIEHKALGGPLLEETYDTDPQPDQVLKRASVQIDAFQQLLPDDMEKPKTSKRKAVLEPDTSGIDWENVYHEGTLSKCKIPDLKKLLKSIGEPVTGNKSVLLERVEQYLKTTASAVKSED